MRSEEAARESRRMDTTSCSASYIAFARRVRSVLTEPLLFEVGEASIPVQDMPRGDAATVRPTCLLRRFEMSGKIHLNLKYVKMPFHQSLRLGELIHTWPGWTSSACHVTEGISGWTLDANCP